jgi:RNA polymerase sigma-70 factor (ECF subfamily)
VKGGSAMHNQSLHTSDDIDDVLNRYSDMVYKIAFSHTGNSTDADDVFQNVFLRYIRCRKQFDSEEHRKAYIIRIAVNQSKSLFRTAWFRKSEPLEEATIFETKEDHDLYFSVLELPVKYRTVIQLHYYEGLGVAQISEVLKVRKSTVKSQLHRARNLLKKLLKGEFEDV